MTFKKIIYGILIVITCVVCIESYIEKQNDTTNSNNTNITYNNNDDNSNENSAVQNNSSAASNFWKQNNSGGTSNSPKQNNNLYEKKNKSVCPLCGGKTTVTCTSCRGTGVFETEKSVPNYSGSGTSHYYTQKTQCKSCRGSGQMMCRGCLGGTR